MTDTVIKGTGNSRTIKAAPATLPATYDEFRAKFISSGIPIDLLGLNDAGLTTRGNALNKSTLLTDALCSALGLAATATPTQAMDKLRQLVATAQSGVDNGLKMEIVSYVGTGTYGVNNPCSITFSFAPKVVIWLGYINSIQWRDNTYRALQSELHRCSILPASILTTKYKESFAFAINEAASSYGKKDSSGHTFTWYNIVTSNGAHYQLNNSGDPYYFMGIG